MSRDGLRRGRSPAGYLRVCLFGVSLFLSAGLLFWVEPLFAKKVLPLLGGSAGVWNTALVFYQATLLAGYLYAHYAPAVLGPRRHVVVHLALLVLPVVLLPVSVPDGWARPPERVPVLWLLGLFVVALGLPFFVLSTTAPLLQRWFSWTGDPEATDPYFLYATSNLGSLVALVAYPTLLAPRYALGAQSRAWAVGYGVVGVLVALCAAVVLRRLREGAAPATVREMSAVVSGAGRRELRWALLGLAPAALLLTVTSHVTTDLAAVPLLWVLPLALYLLSFVLAFSRRGVVPHSWVARLVLPLAVVLVLDLVGPGVTGKTDLTVILPFHLAAFFLVALACHGELARDRPDPRRLTAFYVWMSAGGVVGGLFVALLAPLVFESRAEYPLALALAAGLMATRHGAWRCRWTDIVLPAGLVAAVGFPARFLDGVRLSYGSWEFLGVYALVAVWIYRFRRRPVGLGLGIVALALAASLVTSRGQVLLRERSFYGVIRVVVQEPDVRVLYHGTTVHGMQSTEPGRQTEPVSYYHRQGPVGQLFRQLRADGRSLRRVGVLGLGAGAMACYRRAGEEWTFFEIDPAVIRIATDTTLFRYLGECAPDARIVAGDGRLSLRREPDGSYDLLVMDAFRSDAVPVHLLTREALGLYLEKLDPDGVLAFHISNRYLALGRVVGALARDAGLVGRIQSYRVPDSLEADVGKERSASRWVVVARGVEELGPLAADANWRPLGRLRQGPLWTDDHSALLPVLRW